MRPSLSSLTLQFPTKRIPRPTVSIPPLPNLKYLKITDIDPLCYPDDVSTMLFHAKKLETLKLHWNPRMRDEGEPSIHLHDIFGKLTAARATLPLKEFAIANLFTRQNTEFDVFFPRNTVERCSFINCFGTGEPMTIFLDNTWKVDNVNDFKFTKMKMMRGNCLDKNDVRVASMQTNIEEFYLVNARRKGRAKSKRATPNGNAGSPITPSPDSSTSGSGSGSSRNNNPHLTQPELINLASDYLAVITSKWGPSLRCLLLSDQWQLSGTTVTNLIQNCRNLEQLGVGVADHDFSVLRTILPLAKKLYAVRLLADPNTEFSLGMHEIEDKFHIMAMGRELWKSEYRQLRWMGIGNRIYELGGVKDSTDNQGSRVRSREMRAVTWDDVKHLGIWGYDTLEL